MRFKREDPKDGGTGDSVDQNFKLKAAPSRSAFHISRRLIALDSPVDMWMCITQSLSSQVLLLINDALQLPIVQVRNHEVLVLGQTEAADAIRFSSFFLDVRTRFNMESGVLISVLVLYNQ